MTNRNGRRVRRIVRFYNPIQMQDCFYHLLHLVLVRAAVARYGLLDLERRIFVNRDPAFYRRHDGNAASLCGRNGRFGIIVEKKLFDCKRVRFMLSKQLRELFINLQEAPSKELSRFRFDRSDFQ